MAGIDQVVLGDLVYCKEDCTGKVTMTVNSELEDDGCNDTHDCGHLDEISEIDLPEEKNNPVKVGCFFLALYSFKAFYYC